MKEFLQHKTQIFVIGQVKSDSLDLKRPSKPQIRAVNNQLYSSILLLTQLTVKFITKAMNFSWIAYWVLRENKHILCKYTKKKKK